MNNLEAGIENDLFVIPFINRDLTEEYRMGILAKDIHDLQNIPTLTCAAIFKRKSRASSGGITLYINLSALAKPYDTDTLTIGFNNLNPHLEIEIDKDGTLPLFDAVVHEVSFSGHLKNKDKHRNIEISEYREFSKGLCQKLGVGSGVLLFLRVPMDLVDHERKFNKR